MAFTKAYGIYSRPNDTMPDSARPQTINELLKALRDTGKIPLGVISYDFEKEQIFIQLCPDISAEELRALLSKFKISFMVAS